MFLNLFVFHVCLSRNHIAPTRAGAYNVMLVYFDQKHEVYSSVVSAVMKISSITKAWNIMMNRLVTH